jgi:hypothetical protein
MHTLSLNMAKTAHNGNGHSAHVTETPDVSHIRNVDVTHESSDVSVGGVLKFVAALTIFGIVVFVLTWGLFRFFDAQDSKKDPPPGPMARSEAERLPPEPRLQAARGFGVKLQNGEWVSLEKRQPEAEYRVVRKEWERVLKEGQMDNAGRPVAIPIDEAMQKLLQGGSLKSRTNVWPEVETPTAASSGRVAEKRQP